MRMMKKNKNSKSAFSIAYAIVGLVVVGIAIVGLTPVLTRKLPNLSTSSMIKNPKGWYESYNAAPKGTPYCAECEDADKHNRSWPDNPNYNSGTITGDKVGDPKYNKYVKDPSNLVPFERYCKSSNNCGYPKDKWNEGETHNEKHPHNCTKNADGKCHFKPAPGVTKFEIFAIGGGGGSGSAVAQIPKDKGEIYKNLVVGKSTATPMGANSATDKTNFVQADFIDENFNNTSSVGNSFTRSSAKLEDKVEANITTNKKSATGIFYTAKDTAVSSSKTGKTYPTEAKNATLASFASEQIKRLYKENKKNTNDNDMTGRYYFYTKDLGVYKYNQNSIYTLMPEWLKVYGDEYRYPCNSKDLTLCPNDMYKCDNDKCSGQIQAPDKEITKNYSQIAAVACSGNGGSGGDVYAVQNTPCAWMLPTGCEFSKVTSEEYEQETKTINVDESCGTKDPPESNDDLEDHCMFQSSKTNCSYNKDDEYICTSRKCSYSKITKNRHCVFQPYSNTYVNCTCAEISIRPGCSNNDDAKPGSQENLCNLSNVNKVLDPYSYSDMETLKDWLNKQDDSLMNKEYSFQVNGERVWGVWTNGSAESVMKNINASVKGVEILASDRGAGKQDIKLSMNFPGGGNPVCELIRPYVRQAFGGKYGSGICVFNNRSIASKTALKVSVTPENGVWSDESKQDTRQGCGTANPGNDNDRVAKACINGGCFEATGGRGGQGGTVSCPTCTGSTSNGNNGATGQVFTTNQADDGKHSFSKSLQGSSTKLDEAGELIGTQHKPGLYNYRYVWYMPFVTKHLMFGASGEMGEEVHTMVSLSEGQELIVIPGRGAKMTDYKSGSNGQNGSDSTVKNANNQDGKTKVDITAHGGKGGIGSQKTDEYLLCHIADKQGNKNLPCYKDPKNTNNIEALKQKENTFQNSVRMSDSLKKGNPGIGAMGFGTESVSDFVCEKRHADKWDKINNVDTLTKADVISAGGTLQEACKGNSKIRYILPNSEQYASGTGAVVILW